MSQTRPAVEKKNIRDLLKEKDAFLTTSEKIFEYFLRHTKAVAGGAAVLVLAVIVGVVYVNHQREAEAEAVESYDRALALSAPEATIAALEKVRTDFPDRQAARLAALALVGLYAEARAPEKALPLAENFIQTLRPAEISLKPLLLDNLGGLYETVRDYPQAVRSYQAILESRPLDENLRQNTLMALGRVQAAAGAKEAAVQAYEELLNVSPNSFKAYLAQAHLAELKGEAR
jgi:predicted negative regulator of RcsB-dependent stress response